MPASPHEGSCSRRSCRKKAMWQPIAVLRAGTDGGSKRLLLPLPPLCDQHRGHGRQIAEVLGAVGMELLQASLADELPDIDWDRSRVRFFSLRRGQKRHQARGG